MDQKIWENKPTMRRRPKDRIGTPQEARVAEEIPIMINAMKSMYKEKLLKFELAYKYPNFASPTLTDAYFDAKPFVLLIGQYSVGKTTFIRYLLERDFPGCRVGPEPTTDRFMVLMDGPTDRTIPGNAVVADQSKPFTQLTQFGMGFLNKFECAECKSPILKKVSFIDTPGILSGEKQRTQRGYSFPKMCEWFAGRCDRILLLFDAHKLDISDEMRTTIDAIRDNDDKIRVVLNKADIPTQQLVRVYGALMWSLGKVFQTPEVLRVYIGSFWDQPLKNRENQELINLEKKDLLTDLRTLPKNVAIRKVNELIKRARRAKIHALIVVHLQAQFGLTGAKKKQQKLLDNLGDEFKKVMDQHGVPKNDFPKINKFREELKKHKIKDFPKMQKKLLGPLDAMLTVDMPKLMSMVPSEMGDDEKESDDIASNPFGTADDSNTTWGIPTSFQAGEAEIFATIPQTGGKAKGKDIFPYWIKCGLKQGVLQKIYALADMDQDGCLDKDEFIVGKFIIACVKEPTKDTSYLPRLTFMPEELPDAVVPPSKKWIYDSLEMLDDM